MCDWQVPAGLAHILRWTRPTNSLFYSEMQWKSASENRNRLLPVCMSARWNHWTTWQISPNVKSVDISPADIIIIIIIEVRMARSILTSVGVERQKNRGLISRQGQAIFIRLHSVQTSSGASQPYYPRKIGSSLPEVKRPGREKIHLHLQPRLLNIWRYPSTP
jgi:hypothetical protein